MRDNRRLWFASPLLGPGLTFKENRSWNFKLRASSIQSPACRFEYEFSGKLSRYIFQNPSKINRVSVPWKEIVKFLLRGFSWIYQQYFSQFWGSGATPDQYKSELFYPWGSEIYPGGTEISINQNLFDPWGSRITPDGSRIAPATPRISTNQNFFTPGALRTPVLL